MLIYSYTTREEYKRILIGILIYFAGMRFAMLSGSISTPLYFGNLLSNFSLSVNYFTLKQMKYHIVNMTLFVGLFIQAYAVNSSISLIIAFINFYTFVAVFSSKNIQAKEKRNLILIIIVIITIMLWILSGFNLNAFFDIIEGIMKYMPKSFVSFLFKFFDQSLLPEQILAKSLLQKMKFYIYG